MITSEIVGAFIGCAILIAYFAIRIGYQEIRFRREIRRKGDEFRQDEKDKNEAFLKEMNDAWDRKTPTTLEKE